MTFEGGFFVVVVILSVPVGVSLLLVSSTPNVGYMRWKKKKKNPGVLNSLVNLTALHLSESSYVCLVYTLWSF